MWNWDGVSWEGKKEDSHVGFCITSFDANYAKTFQLVIKTGRFFSSEFPTDSASIVINETAAKILGFKDPIGQVLSNVIGRSYKIIGVVQDFNFASIHRKIEPLLMILGANSSFFIKMKPGTIASTTSFVKKTYESYKFPNRFDLHFLDDDFKTLYRTEQSISKIVACFAFLAIIISCLGLIGLSTFMMERRTKEIGIRKANGAKSTEILYLLSKEYIALVLISLLIASPIAWFSMHKWLQNFACRIGMSWWIFALAGIMVMMITMLTVGFQSYKVARKNPVVALRYE